MQPVSRIMSHDWLGLHKQIAGATLWIGVLALACTFAWATMLTHHPQHYVAVELLLTIGIMLIMGFAWALMRSARRMAEVERDWILASGELQGSQARLQAVVKNMPVGVLVVEAPSGNLISANDQHERLLKQTLTSGVNLWEQSKQKGYHADGRPYEHDEMPITRAMRHGEVVIDEEMWIRRGDGTRACLSINAAPIFSASGAISAAVMAFTDVTERKEMAKERAMLARRLVNAQEDERLRLARELHDAMGQDLTALSLGLKVLEDTVETPPPRESFVRVRKIVENMSIQVHHTASTLRPTMLSHLGLRQAVEDMVATWADRLNLAADIHLEALGHPMDEEGSVTVYRVVQEALTNVAKHSEAKWISVTAQHAAGQLRIVVEDDGKGFDTEILGKSRSRSFGLSGMRERLALVGGRFAVESTPGHGTTIYASLPAALKRTEVSVT
ncbi:MAG: ATP-binding protein [Pseudomonadota bacterium]